MISTQEEILRVALDIYADEGIRGLSMRRIANEVGVSATAIYRHYEDKDALLTAVVDEGFKLFGDYLRRAMEAQTPSERLKQAGIGYLNFALENPAYYNLLFIAPQVWLTPKLPERVRQRSQATFGFLIERLQEAGAADHKSRDAARTVWALTHGLVSLYLVGKLDVSEAEFRELFAKSMKFLFVGINN